MVLFHWIYYWINPTYTICWDLWWTEEYHHANHYDQHLKFSKPENIKGTREAHLSIYFYLNLVVEVQLAKDVEKVPKKLLEWPQKNMHKKSNDDDG